MIANNIFRAIGDFCTDYAFAVYDMFRFTDGWWASNLVNIVIFTIGSLAFIYWLGEMVKHSKDPSAL
jgi:K+-transporting ATPase A subunit